MAVQYDSKNNSWSTWLDVLKNKIPSASKEAVSAFQKIQEQIKQGFELKSYDDFIKENKLADESLISFLKNKEYSEKTLANYQTYLKNSTTGLTLFSRATKTATTVAKKFVATLGSVAATFLVSEGISLIISGISKVKDLIKEEKNATANIINDNYEQAANSIKVHSEAVSQTEERIEKLEDLRSKLDNAKDSEEDFYALSDEIYDATGYWVSGVKNISDAYDTVTKKIDESIKKSKEFEEYHKTREHEELKNKLENSSITSEDEDGNKIAYNFSETANNPNYINDLKIKFGKKTNNFESIQKKDS